MQQESARLAKVTPPIITGIFPRKRLFDLLDIMRQRPVIWVSGPPGCGKTTMVRNYLAAHKIPCLWYQLDEGDADAATFFYYLGLAAKRAAPRKRKTLPLLTPEYREGISTFTMRYFENLYNWLKIPGVLVFDDYQDVPAGALFHKVIRNGLTKVPEGINVILISRREPHPALMRMRANSLMEVLGWDELRLTVEEAEGIMQLRTQQELSNETIEHLHSTTDGWAAGLVLILEGLKTEGVRPQFLGELTSENIFAYFASEIFSKTDRQTQEFLLKTALLPKMTASMAEKLTGLPGADRILSGLNRSNHFTERRFPSDSVYQYHPLFREFLLSRLKTRYSEEELSLFRRDAAMILEEADETEDAISLLYEEKDWDGVVALIMEHAPSMIEHGRTRSLEEWLEKLPKEMMEGVPWLAYWKGMCHFPFTPSSSSHYFERAFEQFKLQGDESGIFLAWSGIVGSICYAREGYASLDRWIQVLEELIEEYKDFPSQEIEARVVSGMFTALAFRQQHHPAIEAWAERAFLLSESPLPIRAKAQVLYMLIFYQVRIGNYEKAALTLDAFKRLTMSSDADPLARILARLAEATYYNVTGMHQKCLKAVSDGLELSRQTGIHILDHMLIRHHIWSALNENDLTTAGKLLEEFASSLSTSKPYERFFYHLLRSREALLRGDLEQADLHVELALKLLEGVGIPFNLTLCYLLKAMVMHGLGRQLEAGNHLEHALRIIHRSKLKIMKFHAVMIRARFSLDRGEVEPCLKSLRNALAMGKKLGYFTIIVEPPAVMARLFTKALEAGIEVEYVQEFIRKRNLILDEPPLHLENWPWALKIYTLGRFRVLRDGKPIRFSRKVQEKPLSLLKALIAFGGREVREEQIADLLWPDADGDTSHISFATTLHRLRKLIGKHDAIQLLGGRLTLDPRYCWVDVWALKHILEQAEAAWSKGQATHDMTKAVELIQRVLDLYQGHFLGETEEPWATSLRERLRTKVMRSVERLGNYWESVQQMENAVECYQRGLEVDEFAEQCYQRLMLCLKHVGRKAEALAVYYRCKKTLGAKLGLEPSPMIETIRRSLLSD